MHKASLVAGAIAALAVAGFWLTPPTLPGAAAQSALPDDLDSWLAGSERAVSAEYDLVAGTEKRIRWQVPRQRSRYSIVYLHGFSATRQEIAPVNELVADRLGANLYETRLTGHGHRRLPMHAVRAEQWLADGVEAISIAAAIGEDVIVIGTSTGATLALALTGHPVMGNVTAIVLISPNIEPADSAAGWLTRPAGPLIARLVSGDTRRWTAHNELQEKFWSTSYPVDAVVEVMRLVDRAQSLLGEPLPQDVLMLLSPADQVISVGAARRAFDAIDAASKTLIEIPSADDPSRHVIAGDILSPGNTEDVAKLIAEFVEGVDLP